MAQWQKERDGLKDECIIVTEQKERDGLKVECIIVTEQEECEMLRRANDCAKLPPGAEQIEQLNECRCSLRAMPDRERE